MYLWVYLVVSLLLLPTIQCAHLCYFLAVHERTVRLAHSLHTTIANPNLSWVFIPLWLMVESYGHIARTLRFAQAAAEKTKTS